MPVKNKSTAKPKTPSRIPLGISSCLLGEEVRYDGGHKHDHFITGSLANYFNFIPICPEVAIGMGVPREPIRLESRRSAIHAVGIHNPTLDVTEHLQRYAKLQTRELTQLCGYIFKRGSPSCGPDKVKLYSASGLQRKTTQGIFANVFMEQQPLIPCVDETQLGDPQLRDNFLQRVFVLHRWRQMVTNRLTAAKLSEFHHRHKYIVMAHQPRAYQHLERLIVAAGKRTVHSAATHYIHQLMATLKRLPTRKQHARVLLQLMGFLQQHLDTIDKQELLDTIASYQHGEIPLIVPITLLNHHVHRHPDPRLVTQYYLTPQLEEWMIRNGK